MSNLTVGFYWLSRLPCRTSDTGRLLILQSKYKVWIVFMEYHLSVLFIAHRAMPTLSSIISDGDYYGEGGRPMDLADIGHFANQSEAVRRSGSVPHVAALFRGALSVAHALVPPPVQRLNRPPTLRHGACIPLAPEAHHRRQSQIISRLENASSVWSPVSITEESSTPSPLPSQNIHPSVAPATNTALRAPPARPCAAARPSA